MIGASQGRASKGMVEDHTQIKGLDEVAGWASKTYPHLFSDDSPEDQLFAMLAGGEPGPMSEADAYEQAMEFLMERKQSQAEIDEPIPFSMVQLGYKSDTPRGLFGEGAKHAPAGGVTVQGTLYSGGQFIPAAVMEKATEAEKEKVEKGEPDKEEGEEEKKAELPEITKAKARGVFPVSEIKSMADIDDWRHHPDHHVKGSIESRYGTLKRLFGEDKADKLMRELEVANWFTPADKAQSIKPTDVLEKDVLDKLKGKEEKKPDQAIVNVPLAKRGNIDAQIDKYKKQQSAEFEASVKQGRKELKDERAEAKELFAKYGEAIAERTAAKHGKTKQEVLAFLKQQVSADPPKALLVLRRAESEGIGEKKDHAPTVLAAFDKLAKGPRGNFVDLADLHDETGLPIAELHAAVQQLRRDGVLTGSGREGRHGISEKQKAASIREKDGEVIGFVSRKHQPAKEEAAKPAPVSPVPQPAAKADGGFQVPDDLPSRTSGELRAIAKMMGVEHPLGASKSVILKAMQEHQARQTAKPVETKPTPEPSPVSNPTPEPKQPDPVSEPTTPEAVAAEPKPDDTPRDVAERVAKAMDPAYEFARASAVGNIGEDLKGSARHKANHWRGLEEAEKDGTAAEMVKRENLFKVEPHSLLANISQTNALPSLAAHLALNAFPAEPGEYPAAYHRYRGRDGSTMPPPTPPEKLREQYLEAYREVKKAAEEAAQKETDPRAVIKAINAKTTELIKKFRGAKGDDHTSHVIAPDSYNPVANELVSLYKRTKLGYGPKTTDTIARVMDFVGRIKKAYPGDPTTETMDKIMGHVSDVIEGESFNKTFGTEGSKVKYFDPAQAYVKHAERKGGRMIDAKTVEAGAKFMKDSLKLRGVQWGNYVTDDERVHHLTKSAEALADLADVTGLPDDAISLGNKIGLAIGARGRAGALAHYEPGTQVINLTRAGGVGSLAHEWGHAMDHFLGQWGKYHSDSYGGSYRNTDADDPTSKAMQDVHKALSDSGFKERLRDQVRLMIRSGEISKGKEDYWNSPIEVFARSFERYVQHSLRADGRENTYLTGAMDHPLWPNDEEIKKIAPVMKALLSAVKEKHFKP
jgi:hypothetical protein